MKKMSEVFKLPLRYEPPKNLFRASLQEAGFGGDIHWLVDTDANKAAAIARAVNAHDDLVEACDKALIALCLANQDRFDGGKVCNMLRNVLAKAGHVEAVAALAKATKD